MNKTLKYFTKSAVCTLFPKICALCKKTMSNGESSIVCKDCESKLERIEGLICQMCGRPLESGGEHCYDCLKNREFKFDLIRSVFRYEGKVKDLILRFKYKNRDYYGEYFSRYIFDLLKESLLLDKIDCIVPVPAHFLRQFFRGYNQSEILAEHISLMASKPLVVNALRRHKYTKAQFKLKKRQRRENIKGVFVLDKPDEFKNKKVLIVDDICTTSSTINECARVLKENKAARVYALTIARD